jgi:NAD(P)-dependent dehydrogenase (short-subunit alcohol dehydrogenase family)
MNFQNKVAVITGGALGIGQSLTREFAKAGARVAFADFNRSTGENTLKCIQESGGDAFFYFGDIGEESALKEFAGEVICRYGNVDFLINNAMVTRKGILSDCSFEDFNYVLRIGVSAPYMLTKLFLKYYNANASIVNISSTRAFQSQKDTESYTAAKGGITALTHALAVSLEGRARVNSVAPGWIDTGAYQQEQDYVPDYSGADMKQHPAGRVGAPIDIVKIAMFLCSEDAGFITGENITVDGGMTKLMIYHNDNGWKYESQKMGAL